MVSIFYFQVSICFVLLFFFSTLEIYAKLKHRYNVGKVGKIAIYKWGLLGEKKDLQSCSFVRIWLCWEKRLCSFDFVEHSEKLRCIHSSYHDCYFLIWFEMIVISRLFVMNFLWSSIYDRFVLPR